MCLRPTPSTAEPPRPSCPPCYRCASPAEVPLEALTKHSSLTKQLTFRLLHGNGAFWARYLSGPEQVCSAH